MLHVIAAFRGQNCKGSLHRSGGVLSFVISFCHSSLGSYGVNSGVEAPPCWWEHSAFPKGALAGEEAELVSVFGLMEGEELNKSTREV